MSVKPTYNTLPLRVLRQTNILPPVFDVPVAKTGVSCFVPSRTTPGILAASRRSSALAGGFFTRL